MYIDLHQPVKSARRLGMPLRIQFVIVAAIVWMWLRMKISTTIKSYGTNFNPVDRFVIAFKDGMGMLLCLGWDQKEHFVLSVIGSLADIKVQLQGLHFTFTDCHEKTTVLPCGCTNTFLWLVKAEPFSEGQVPCEDCGMYHRGTSRKDDINHDCEKHFAFFQKWPEIRRGFYSNGKCPQMKGFTPDDAMMLLYQLQESGPIDRNLQEELCAVVAKGSYESGHVAETFEFVDSDLRGRLALSVKKQWQAKRILEKNTLGAKATRHLRLVVWSWRCLFFLLCLLLASAVSVAWLWHLPDWRTVLVIAITAFGVWVGFALKEWTH